jgi:uncharacterized integral membrane protein
MRLLDLFLSVYTPPLTVSFALGLLIGGLIMWLLAYRRYKRTRRIRYQHKLAVMRETSRLEKEME